MTHGPLCPKTLKILGSVGVKINLLIKQFFFLCGKKAKIVDSKIIGSKKILSFKIQCKNIFFSFFKKKRKRITTYFFAGIDTSRYLSVKNQLCKFVFKRSDRAIE